MKNVSIKTCGQKFLNQLKLISFVGFAMPPVQKQNKIKKKSLKLSASCLFFTFLHGVVVTEE